MYSIFFTRSIQKIARTWVQYFGLNLKKDKVHFQDMQSEGIFCNQATKFLVMKNCYRNIVFVFLFCLFKGSPFYLIWIFKKDQTIINKILVVWRLQLKILLVLYRYFILCQTTLFYSMKWKNKYLLKALQFNFQTP